MGSGNRKEFLNTGILGDGAGVATKRDFRAISTEYIGSPDYNPRFFETFPTAWASAYAFVKALDTDGKGTTAEQNRASEEAATAATEEWVSLFLLHYFGVVHLAQYNQDDLEKNYDKDLWLALNGTFPSSKAGSLPSIKLLKISERTVVGAYYPEVVFFPSRGRALWLNEKEKVLSQFLVGTKLSWDLCSRSLLTNDSKVSGFHEHLMRIIGILPSQALKTRLQRFCDRSFKDSVQPTGTLDKDPMLWDIPGTRPPEPRELLDRYPLKKSNKKGGHTYYLVSTMPHTTPWMTATIIEGCSPYQYRRTGEHEITVQQAGGREIKCRLDDEKDEVIALKDLFLSEPPYWCKVKRSSDAHTSKIKALHRVELRDPVLKQEEIAICLAPVRREFLEHFPEAFNSLNKVSASPDLQHASVEWVFPILGHEVRWHTTPVGQREMPNTSVALWPPKVSRRWTLYAVYGTGSKEACGRWHLIDEKGSQGNKIELEEVEYVSVLQRLGDSNRPKALLFTDNNDSERGIVFLSDLEEQGIGTDDRANAALSIDFGTSNTCLAYKKGESAILKFSLSPLMLWGERPKLERPGFAPFRWGGGKGFFPTILLSRKSDIRLDEVRSDDIQLEHLFKIDIPGLHSEMEERLYEGRLNEFWNTHTNMKWDLDIKTPWRSLFLGLSLLYAHAEILFGGSQGAKISKYIFTFPLAFSDTDRKEFHAETQKAIRKVRQFCYGNDPLSDTFEYLDTIDESTAIARSARVGAAATTMEVFIDVGGGTADIAVRHGNNFLVLDSIKVAGSTFFRFAETNFKLDLKGASTFKRHLARVLLGKADAELERKSLYLDLGTFYSLAINGLSDEDFRKREGKVIQEGMADDKKGGPSYQRYRTQLFFRHILAYALLQACAAAVDGKIKLDDGIKLILGGNAWGLMLFAEFPRKKDKLEEEADLILRLLKERLSDSAEEEDDRQYLNSLSIFGVELLNEINLSKAKTDVAVGALKAGEDRKDGRGDNKGTMPYAGITIKNLKIDTFEPTTVRWCDRWGFEQLRKKLGDLGEIKSARFDQPKGLRKPMDVVLSVFTCLGNSGRSDQDNMPGETWRDINAELCEEITSLQGNRLGRSPINHFISKVLYPEDEQRDFLDKLAEENGNYKSERG